jgi:hypothetical protein
MGTFLVSIHSEQKMHQIMEAVTNLGRWDIWIGLNRRNKEDQYLWDNGEPVKFTNWDKGKFYKI